MTRYHITSDGPKPCHATKKPCPIGGEHYTNEAEAQKAFAEDKQIVPSFKKTSDAMGKAGHKYRDLLVNDELVYTPDGYPYMTAGTATAWEDDEDFRSDVQKALQKDGLRVSDSSMVTMVTSLEDEDLNQESAAWQYTVNGDFDFDTEWPVDGGPPSISEAGKKDLLKMWESDHQYEAKENGEIEVGHVVTRLYGKKVLVRVDEEY